MVHIEKKILKKKKIIIIFLTTQYNWKRKLKENI